MQLFYTTKKSRQNKYEEIILMENAWKAFTQIDTYLIQTGYRYESGIAVFAKAMEGLPFQYSVTHKYIMHCQDDLKLFK